MLLEPCDNPGERKRHVIDGGAVLDGREHEIEQGPAARRPVRARLAGIHNPGAGAARDPVGRRAATVARTGPGPGYGVAPHRQLQAAVKEALHTLDGVDMGRLVVGHGAAARRRAVRIPDVRQICPGRVLRIVEAVIGVGTHMHPHRRGLAGRGLAGHGRAVGRPGHAHTGLGDRPVVGVPGQHEQRRRHRAVGRVQAVGIEGDGGGEARLEVFRVAIGQHGVKYGVEGPAHHRDAIGIDVAAPGQEVAGAEGVEGAGADLGPRLPVQHARAHIRLTARRKAVDQQGHITPIRQLTGPSVVELANPVAAMHEHDRRRLADRRRLVEPARQRRAPFGQRQALLFGQPHSEFAIGKGRRCECNPFGLHRLRRRAGQHRPPKHRRDGQPPYERAGSLGFHHRPRV